MSILKSIAAAKEATPTPRTLYKSFYAWYESLTLEDQKALDEALLDPEISTRQLFRALKTEEQVPWGDNAIYFHASTLRQEN